MAKKPSIFVLKLGGKLLENFELRKKAAEKVAVLRAQGHMVLVVVSAIGSETDRLLDLFSQISDSPNLREVDRGISTGENLSAALFSAHLNALGVPAKSLDAAQAGIHCTKDYGRARIIGISKVHELKMWMRSMVLVVTGFQGIVSGTNELATLDRGGSDATAIALAAALRARICWLYKDVDGIYAVNPKLVPNAKRYEKVSYAWMAAFAQARTEVLMYRAILLAQRFKVKIKVILSPNIGESDGGSVIYDFPGNLHAMESEESLRGLVIKRGLAGIKVMNVPNFPGEAAKITTAFGKQNIIESGQGFISSMEKASMSFLFTEKELLRAEANFASLYEGDQNMLAFKAIMPLALLTFFDPDMQDQNSYLKNCFDILGGLGVNIEMYTTGPSTINIVITDVEENVKLGAQALAREFKLIKEE